MHLHVVVIDEAVEKIDAKQFHVVICVFIQCVEAGLWIAIQSIIHIFFCALSVSKLVEVHLRGAVIAPCFLVEVNRADPWIDILLCFALQVEDRSGDFEALFLSKPVIALEIVLLNAIEHFVVFEVGQTGELVGSVERQYGNSAETEQRAHASSIFIGSVWLAQLNRLLVDVENQRTSLETLAAHFTAPWILSIHR